MKIGKRALYKLACEMFKDIDFPESKLCHYYFCSPANNEVLESSNFFICRNIYSGIFMKLKFDVDGRLLSRTFFSREGD